jgi:dTDP-4-dehydrorhamnose reductase
MNESTLLITGIHGLVGQYVFKILESWEGRVVITGKGPSRLPAHRFFYANMDITDKKQVLAVFDEFKPDVVIHSAAQAQPDHCELNQEDALKTNVEGTEHLLQAASLTKAFFIYLSTDFVFSGNDEPYDEHSIPAPVNFYGQTKWMAEQRVSAYPFPWAIVRTALVYGNVISGTRSNMISWVKTEIENKRPIKVVSDQLRTTTYAADLAAALLVIAKRKMTGIWHISGKDALSPWEIANAVADHLQLDRSLITKVDAAVFSQPATRPLRTPLIIDKAIRELGYQPLSFEEGMKKVLKGD